MLEDRKTIYYDNILGIPGQFEKEKSQIFMIIREIRFISAISKFSEYLQHWEDFKKYKRCYVERPQGERIWKTTGWFRIQCQAIVGSISRPDYYEFGVNEMQQYGLVWSRLWSKSASQIKTCDTLVVIQNKPNIAWHWILIHPVHLNKSWQRRISWSTLLDPSEWTKWCLLQSHVV